MKNEYEDIAKEDWNRRDKLNRVHWLMLEGFPASSAEWDYEQLDPRVQEAFYEDTIEHAKMCAE